MTEKQQETQPAPLPVLLTIAVMPDGSTVLGWSHPPVKPGQLLLWGEVMGELQRRFTSLAFAMVNSNERSGNTGETSPDGGEARKPRKRAKRSKGE